MSRGDASKRHEDYAVSETAYRWSMRLFSTLTRMLKVKIRLHGDTSLLGSGQIFVFNHFSRFETLVPQYLIHRETGAHIRAIASKDFFGGDDLLSNYLRSVGAVPNDMPGLFPFLAAELLAGRKLVVFPEGGMVKDRRVLDERGAYSVYSRTARARRKHHRGPAVLAQTLDVFKAGLLACDRAGDTAVLERWAEQLGFDSRAALLTAASRPTLIIPANITFYPLRVDDNLLRRAAELLPGDLSPRTVEELKVEGNILLRDTDMDIRLGAPVSSAPWRFGSSWLVRRFVRRAAGLEDLFTAREGGQHGRMLRAALLRRIHRTRDRVMHEMYTGVTLNLSHLVSQLLVQCAEHGWHEIPGERFRLMLYVLIKQVQELATVQLHDSLREHEAYAGLPDTPCEGLRQLLDTAERLGLIARDGDLLRLLPKLTAESDFDRVRLENPVVVSANEAEPLRNMHGMVRRLVTGRQLPSGAALAGLLFDDELRRFDRARIRYGAAEYAEINDRETATASGAPFLLAADSNSPVAVLMVHGFLASPAEVRGCAERIAADGTPVVGIRLSGHGTSPADLLQRGRGEWLDSVRRGYRIAATLAERVVVVGFSTGGALALLLAAEGPERLDSVVAVSPTLRFADRNMRLVPLVHHANRLARWTLSDQGLMTYRTHVSEHPDINYRQMPVHGLFELLRLVDDLESRLPAIRCPVLLMHATADPVVTPSGSETIYDRLTSAPLRRLCWIDSSRHGILHEDIGGTQAMVREFVRERSFPL